MIMERIVYEPGKTADTQKSPVGMYHIFVGEKRDTITSDVACPYCEALMSERRAATPLIARVTKEFSRNANGIIVGVEFVPDTHRVLQCLPCKQVFTMPKEVL